MQLTDTQQAILKQITKAYNDELRRRYGSGELDFIPKDKTEKEMLDLILAESTYAGSIKNLERT